MASLGVPLASVPSPGDQCPRNSILLNPHEVPLTRGRSSESKIKIRAPAPAAVRVPPLQPPAPQRNPSVGDATSPGSESPRIRFAPLPDPHRPRSMSTGRNIRVLGSDGPNGEREYHLELRDMGEGYENAVEDDDEDDGMGDDDDAEYSDDDSGRRKSWAVSMGKSSLSMGKSSWKGTKKLLGAKPKEEELGAPLKKSVSTGGVTTSSPFKWTGGGDASMFGTSPKASSSLLSGRRGSSASGGSTAASASAHRRGSSGDMVNPNPSGNPKPARMLNGRMYGARRASEAAALEKQRREKAEPSFVEWGAGGAGTVTKSLGTSKEDNEDGGGMAWVKRRREERERRQREEEAAAAAAAASAESASPSDPASTTSEPAGSKDIPIITSAERPASLSSSAGSSSPADGPSNVPLTPHEPSSDLHTAFSQYNGFGVTNPDAAKGHGGHEGPSHDVALDNKSAATAGEHDSSQHVHRVSIPNAQYPGAEEEDEEDPDDDGDFDNDDEDEEELLAGMGGVCASAAGVEILSRHKS